jgi:WD40 repeat protein
VFVQYFGMAIAKSAPHVYLSALPFAPINSLVSTNYSSSFPHTLHVKHGQLSHWPLSGMVIPNVRSAVLSIALSPDGQHIISGLHNHTICVWNATTGEMVAGPFIGHTGPVNSVDISPNGQLIVSGSSDQTICVWNAMTGEAVTSPFTGHTGSVNSVRILTRWPVDCLRLR